MILETPNRQRSLRVALVSTCAVATPPRAYGGTELVVAELAKGLIDLGHDVTVFATADSTARGDLRAIVPFASWEPDPLRDLRHAEFAWSTVSGSGDFDVVHVHAPVQLSFSRFVGVPTVATVHHDRIASETSHYTSYPEATLVAISARQAALSPDISFRAVVLHGLDPSAYPEGSGSGGYLAFLGRFSREKGPHVAVEAAARAGVPVRLAGIAHEDDLGYCEELLYPGVLASACATTCGEVGHAAKLELLRGARALLFPIAWDEPFGLVMIESMLVGTPVIAFRRGSTPEIVDEGVTGFLVDDAAEMAERIRRLGEIDRERCRTHAVRRFSHMRMARDYASVYEAAMMSRGTTNDTGHGRGGYAEELRHGRASSPE